MSNPNIKVTVVVSSQAVEITLNPNQKVSQLIKEALRVAGASGQQGGEWELRDDAGNLIDPSARIEDAGIVDGSTVHLNPGAGAGGE